MEPVTFNPRTLEVKIPKGSRVDRAKFPAALKMIATSGAKISAAFRAAGYTPNYAGQVTGNKKMAELIYAAQNAFVDNYMSESAACGLDAKKTATTLNAVIDTGDNMEKVNAVKAHHQVILQTMAIRARGNSPNFSLNQQNFIMPSTRPDDDWKSAAIEAQAEELLAAKEMEAGLPVSAPPVPARSMIQPERWKRGRSAAIKRGHATRKRNAMKRDADKRKQARKPRVS